MFPANFTSRVERELFTQVKFEDGRTAYVVSNPEGLKATIVQKAMQEAIKQFGFNRVKQDGGGGVYHLSAKASKEGSDKVLTASWPILMHVKRVNVGR